MLYNHIIFFTKKIDDALESKTSKSVRFSQSVALNNDEKENNSMDSKGLERNKTVSSKIWTVFALFIMVSSSIKFELKPNQSVPDRSPVKE